jgi:uncharacterized Ntn-hydrolase superfamily protein
MTARGSARRVAVITALAGLVSLSVAAPASATWSIVAVDPDTQEVGVAVASCVEAPFGTTILPQVPALAPGIGALAAQAQFSQATRDQALDLLLAGQSPMSVIDMVLAGDPSAASRQYAVVDLRMQVAAYTGDATMAWAGHATGSRVSVQGNILYGPEVVDDALAAFEAPAPRCPWTLADRLLVALEAGSAQGGDNRCSEEQSALAADLMVAKPGDVVGAPSLDLRIESQPMGGENPVELLRAAYDQWRVTHPPDDSACGAGSGSDDGNDATSGGGTSPVPPPAASTSGAADGDDDASSPAPTSAPSSDGAAGSSSAFGSSSALGPPAEDARARGCGCDTARPHRREIVGAALVLLVIGPRRRKTALGSVS